MNRALHLQPFVRMTSSYKPEAYSTVSPYLVVDGASGTILRRASGSEASVTGASVRMPDAETSPLPPPYSRADIRRRRP